MGRRWYPHLIADIERLDADGHFIVITRHPEGPWTVSKVDPKAEQAD